MSKKNPSDKKCVTVMVPENLHRKVKVLAELSGTSLSDLVEEMIDKTVKARLPRLLGVLMPETATPTPAE